MTDELRKLLAVWQATEEMHEHAHSAQDAYIEALVDAAPGLFDACDKAAARIRALTAERDLFAESAKNAEQEGERRATAAIVADLRDVCGAWPRGTSHASILADRYERGDHLTHP